MITLVSSCHLELPDSHSISSLTRCMLDLHSLSSEAPCCESFAMHQIKLIAGTEALSESPFPLWFGLFTPAPFSLKGLSTSTINDKI